MITFRAFVHHYIKQLLRQYYGYKTTATHRRAKPQTARRGGVCRQSGTYWRRPVMPQRDDGTLFPCHERTRSDPKAPLRDRFVLSKGHCVESLYVTLEAKGYLKPEVLDTLGQFGSILSGHPTIEVPGIEVNSGALGHGLSIGVGMAIAAKMDQQPWRTYVMMGDGEQGEGSIYEAAMAANRYHLDNLVAIIDRNHLQISGNTEDVMPIDNIHDRWTAFGWDVILMNGDSMDDIIRTFDNIDYNNGKPHLLVSDTTKGKGVSFMEGIAKWHHGVLNAEQCEAAVAEIQQRIDALKS